MLTYLRKRIISSAVPLLVVIVGVFALARMTGNPASLYLPLNATEAMREDFAIRNGLDQPIWVQMADYFGGVLRFDFGSSMRTGESAAAMALRAFPATLQLAGHHHGDRHRAGGHCRFRRGAETERNRWTGSAVSCP